MINKQITKSFFLIFLFRVSFFLMVLNFLLFFSSFFKNFLLFFSIFFFFLFSSFFFFFYDFFCCFFSFFLFFLLIFVILGCRWNKNTRLKLRMKNKIYIHNITENLVEFYKFISFNYYKCKFSYSSNNQKLRCSRSWCSRSCSTDARPGR